MRRSRQAVSARQTAIAQRNKPQETVIEVTEIFPLIQPEEPTILKPVKPEKKKRKSKSSPKKK